MNDRWPDPPAWLGKPGHRFRHHDRDSMDSEEVLMPTNDLDKWGMRPDMADYPHPDPDVRDVSGVILLIVGFVFGLAFSGLVALTIWLF